jgi:hypothetical protein
MVSLIKSIEIKKLIFQVSYLSAEYNEIMYKCDSIDQEIGEYIKENYPEQYKDFLKQQVPDTNDAEATENDIEINSEDENDYQKKCQNKDLKKLYRKIIEITHPDKAEDKEDIFREATKFYKEENLAKLLEIAFELRIKINELSDESLEMVQENIEDLEIKVGSLKKSTAWAWHNCDSGEDKDILAQMILSYKGIKIP